MRLDHVRREIPRDLVTIVQKAIEKEPSRRYATAEQLAADLERFIDDEPILARRQTELERYVRWARHHPGIAVLGAVLTAVLLIATIASLVVAGQMISLASEAAQKAADERLARLQAVDAQKREADERAKAELAKKAAENSFAEAREAQEQGRKLLYATDMQLAPFVWKDDRSTADQLRVLLAKHVPESPAGSGDPRRAKAEGGRTDQRPDSSFILHPSSLLTQSDLRGFEWYYYQHLVENSATVFSGHGVSLVGGAFTSDGRLVTLDQRGQVRRWDLESQAEEKACRRDLPGGAAAQAVALSPDGHLAALAAGNKVRLFDTSTGNETSQIDSADLRFRDLIFSGDSATLVIVDDRIRFRNAISGEVIASRSSEIRQLRQSRLVCRWSDAGRRRAWSQRRTVFDFPPGRDRENRDSAGNGRHRLLRRNVGCFRAQSGRPATRCRLGVDRKRDRFRRSHGRGIAEHFSAHASPVTAMTFSGDGAKLATADDQGTIKIWASPHELNSKSTALVTLKGHHGSIKTVGFASDGKRLFTTSADNTARVWDLETAGAAIRQLETGAHHCRVVRFSPDGQLIAAASARGLCLWDAATGRLVRKLSGGGRGSVISVAFSPTDNRLLAVGYTGQPDDRYISLWDVDTAVERARLPVGTDLPGFRPDNNLGAAGSLAFSPDGKYLVAGFGLKHVFDERYATNPLRVWEVATRRLIHRLDGHTGYCLSLDFSRDGALLASGSRDGTAIIWSTDTWKAKETLRNPDQGPGYGGEGRKDMVADVAFSPDGKTLALASLGGSVQLWDVATGKLLEPLNGHSGAVLALAFSPDGRTLASGGTDQTVRLWNVETRRELMRLDSGHVVLHEVWSLAFSADGKQLIAGGGADTGFWSAAPIFWTDPDRAAPALRDLLRSNADFRSRIRMLSENLRLHESLERLDAKDARVQAAVAATQASRHAACRAWPEAVRAFDRLVAADPAEPDAWLRTPGLLRLATALRTRIGPVTRQGCCNEGQDA